MESTLNELFENKNLKFIFVGGKGGVGKTTTSSSIAIQLAKRRGKTLIISTDPAHNLSDAFNQQFSYEPTAVSGVDNLFGVEIDPKKSMEWANTQLFENQIDLQNNSFNFSFMSDVLNAMPGIDEAIVFSKLLQMAKEMDVEVVVFDTAPTGHTLKLLGFPGAIQKGMVKLMEMKDKFSGVFSILGESGSQAIEKIMSKVEGLKNDVDNLKLVLTNPNLTTFVCVCIPEFLSVYETERLVQELTLQEIDVFNVVTNQIVFFDESEKCTKCRARYSMQLKYIKQIKELYPDYHVVLMPIENEEVRGIEKLTAYGEKLGIEKALPIL